MDDPDHMGGNPNASFYLLVLREVVGIENACDNRVDFELVLRPDRGAGE